MRKIESERMEKLYHGNTNQNKSDLAILILDRMDFQARSFARDKEGYFVRRKKSFPQEDTIILKQKWMELDKSTITVGDFNMPLSSW